MNEKPSFFLDYIYFRITKAYFRFDGRSGFTAICGITMVELVLLLDGLEIIGLVFNDGKPIVGALGESITTTIATITILGLLFFNYKKYDGSYSRLMTYWKDETTRQRILKGLAVWASMLLPVVLFVVLMESRPD